MRIEKRKYKDRREYIKNAVTKRREKLRGMALELKGGKCEICGYNRCGRALNFLSFRLEKFTTNAYDVGNYDSQVQGILSPCQKKNLLTSKRVCLFDAVFDKIANQNITLYGIQLASTRLYRVNKRC